MGRLPLISPLTVQHRQKTLNNQVVTKWLEDNTPEEIQNHQEYVSVQIPGEDPMCNSNREEGLRRLRRYREALLQGFQKGSQKTTNINKVAETLQRKDESPGDFYERLCETYQIYTPFDPGSPDNHRMVNMAFVGQSAGDIKRKN